MSTHVRIFYRRCHLCSRTTFADQRVEQCSHCGKPLARFFYFNEQYVSIDSDHQTRPPLMPGELRPLMGVSVYWAEWMDDP